MTNRRKPPGWFARFFLGELPDATIDDDDDCECDRHGIDPAEYERPEPRRSRDDEDERDCHESED